MKDFTRLGKVHPNTRHFTASMVVIDPHAGKVLLVKHRATGWWQFPGGHIDADEAAHQAALREVREETGITVVIALQDPWPRVGMITLPAPWLVNEIVAPARPGRPDRPSEPEHSHIDLLFVGIGSSNFEPRLAPAEAFACGWWPIGELENLPGLRGDVREVTTRALAALTQSHTTNLT